MKKIFLILILLSNFISAQIIKSWHNYSNLRAVAQSCLVDGVVWAATDGGAFSFYPNDSTYQILTKSEGLLSQNITAISSDDENKIWLGTNEGYIIVYAPSTGEIHSILEIYKTDKSIKTINNITISGDTAFVSTAFGLSLINTKDYSFFDSILKFGDFTSETPVTKVYLGSTIYVITQAGIAYKKSAATNLTAPESWANMNVNSDIPASRVNSIVEDGNTIFAATNKGLLQMTDNWKAYLYDDFEVFDIIKKGNVIYSLLNNTIHKNDGTDQVILNSGNINYKHFLLSGDNKFYISSNKGLLIFSDTSVKYIFPNGPAANTIIDLTVDSDNNLWSATGKNGEGVGVLKFDGSNWSVNDKMNNNVFTSNDFHKVSSFSNEVYFSTWGRGFVRYKNGSYERFDADNTNLVGIPDNNKFLVINDIKEDENGNAWILNYWAANKRPISVLRPNGTFISYELGSSLPSSIINVKELVIDQYNTKWFTGDLSGDVPTEGLFYFNENGTLENLNDDVWGRLTEFNGLRNRDVKALAIDKFGELIVGTSVGVDVIPNPNTPGSIRNDQYFALRQQTINAIAVDAINQKWFGTEKGVFLMSADGSSLIANYTKSNSPLPSDNIKSISIDVNNGIVYVGTNFGLSAISTLFIKPNENFSEISVYPNPITLSDNSNSNLIIDGLIADSEIKVLDIGGNLIDEFRSIGGKTTYWNCKDSNGKLIPSGVYIIIAYDTEVNQVGQAKVAVLRK